MKLFNDVSEKDLLIFMTTNHDYIIINDICILNLDTDDENLYLNLYIKYLYMNNIDYLKAILDLFNMTIQVESTNITLYPKK